MPGEDLVIIYQIYFVLHSVCWFWFAFSAARQTNLTSDNYVNYPSANACFILTRQVSRQPRDFIYSISSSISCLPNKHTHRLRHRPVPERRLHTFGKPWNKSRRFLPDLPTHILVLAASLCTIEQKGQSVVSQISHVLPAIAAGRSPEQRAWSVNSHSHPTPFIRARRFRQPNRRKSRSMKVEKLDRNFLFATQPFRKLCYKSVKVANKRAT